MAAAIRIVSWNVESLLRWLEPGGPDFGAQFAALGSPAILCLQEIRVRPGDHAISDRLYKLLPTHACHFSLCDDPRNVTFRGGRAHGVATFVAHELGETSPDPPAWDREGRVVVTHLPGRKLAVINFYAVNGTSRPYYDPDTGELRGDRHAFKRDSQRRVLALAAELARTTDVVVAGDWNVSRSIADVTPRLRTEEPHALARAELNAALDTGDWVDIFRARNPDARRYTWFGRTRTGAMDAARVDYFVVSRSLVPRVTAAEILDARALRPHSDHAPLVLELS